MVKFHESTFAHDYPFPTVTLAYFLRYPNPHAIHVMSTDVIERHFDPQTSRLYTARLHLKKSKLPTAIIKLLPRSWLGGDDKGQTTSYILERSVVDMKEGVMITESQNLELRGILSVVERQMYWRPDVDVKAFLRRYNPISGFRLQAPTDGSSLSSRLSWSRKGEASTLGTVEDAEISTQVATKVELYSRLGEVGRRHLRRKAEPEQETTSAAQMATSEEEEESVEETPSAKPGFFRSLGIGSMQRSIEAIGLRRTERAVPNSKKGMNVVLERLRIGGLVAVLDGMRKDREAGMNMDIQ